MEFLSARLDKKTSFLRWPTNFKTANFQCELPNWLIVLTLNTSANRGISKAQVLTRTKPAAAVSNDKSGAESSHRQVNLFGQEIADFCLLRSWEASWSRLPSAQQQTETLRPPNQWHQQSHAEGGCKPLPLSVYSSP
ncbi:hypothetical protein [Hyphomonas sp.]|uniref:hypothetical protein n=1 Tax=Hyphomonas sp. TaxID=87 RepID=UPI0025C3AB1D|nr:hypothetical protein [Hyphomonas sp.]